jgi:hypothetical protein
MRDRNKNKILRLPDFFSYKGDKMSGKERNSFERELQRDPFAEEASEGYASVTTEEALKDLASLQKKLKHRTEKRQKVIFLRIAASVAVLMIAASLFIVFERKSAPKQIAANTDQAESLEIIESQPVSVPAEKKELPEQPVSITGKKESKSAVQQMNPEPLILSENIRADAYQKSDSMKEPVFEVADNYVLSGKRALVPPTTGSRKKNSAYTIEGKVVSSEDNLPVAGVTVVMKGERNGVITDASGNFNIDLPDAGSHTLIASYIGMGTKEFELKADTPVIIKLDPDLVALNEIVVTAYGISRSEAEAEYAPKDYVPPQPSGGKPDFDKYIRENLQWPDTVSYGRKIVVVLSFSVHTDGRVDSIMIIRSPGRLFSEEAIRLIRSGPAWQPAMENGKIIEDKVRLRIVFK